MTPTLHQAHLQSFYRPLVIFFLCLAAGLLTIVLFAGTAGATISITLVPQELKTTIIITVGPKTDGGALYLTGTVMSETLEASTTVKPGGQGILTPAHAQGSVTFHNTTGKAQPLATGTRLRPIGGGVIVRTIKRVDVPAGGTIAAEVVADPLGAAGNLAPGKFIIVALWPGLQDKIYATSDQAFTGGLVSQAGGLSLDELTAASNQAEENIRQKFGADQLGQLVQLLPLEVAAVPPASEPSSEYTVTVKMKALTVTYDPDALTGLIRQRLQPLIPEDQALSSLEQPALTIENQPTAEEVVIIVKAVGYSRLAADSARLQTKQFIGLNRQAIVARLSDHEFMENINVKFSPPWRQTAPQQADRIKVIIKNP